MSERRRAEIAEKRARLAQLKQAREEREQQARAAAAASLSASGLPSPAPASGSSSDPAGNNPARSSRGSLAASTSSRHDEIDSLLRTVGVAPDRSSPLRRDSAAPSASSHAPSAAGDDQRDETQTQTQTQDAPTPPAPASAPAPAIEHVAGEPTWPAPPPSTDACATSHPRPPRGSKLTDRGPPHTTQPHPPATVVVVHRSLLAPAQTQGRLRQRHPDLSRPLSPRRARLDLDLDEHRARTRRHHGHGGHERDGRRAPRAHRRRARSRARRPRRRHRLGARPRPLGRRSRARARPRPAATRERVCLAGLCRVRQCVGESRREGAERLV